MSVALSFRPVFCLVHQKHADVCEDSVFHVTRSLMHFETYSEQKTPKAFCAAAWWMQYLKLLETETVKILTTYLSIPHLPVPNGLIGVPYTAILLLVLNRLSESPA